MSVFFDNANTGAAKMLSSNKNFSNQETSLLKRMCKHKKKGTLASSLLLITWSFLSNYIKKILKMPLNIAKINALQLFRKRADDPPTQQVK